MPSDFTDDLRLAHVLADDADSLTGDRFKALDLHVTRKPDLTPVTDADRPSAFCDDETASEIYTSGSTGTPKGVEVTAGGVGRLAGGFGGVFASADPGQAGADVAADVYDLQVKPGREQLCGPPW